MRDDREPRYEGRRPGGRELPHPGHDAESPRQIPRSGWKQILGRVKDQVGEDDLPMLAAALAFYAVLALFPALIALITVYGLVADPQQVQEQLSSLTQNLQGGAGQLLRDQLTSIVSASRSSLSWGLLASVVGALWAASSGMQALIKAVNIAYDEDETRGFFKMRGLSLLLTLGGVVFVIVSVALIAVLPPLLDGIGLGDVARKAIAWGRWPLLALFAMGALAIIYKLAPDRDAPRFRWVSWGAGVATIVWLIASWGFSFYVQNFGSYNETYGSLAGIVVLLMWFYISALVILLGAELNAEIELQTGVDTTVGPERPRGERRAVKADDIPPHGAPA